MRRSMIENEWCNIHDWNLQNSTVEVWPAGWLVGKQTSRLLDCVPWSVRWIPSLAIKLTNKYPVDVQRVQDSYRPDGHRRTKKRSLHHRRPQIRGPVRLILDRRHLPLSTVRL